ncbi:MAG: heme-binding protein [Burkholderiales bacterium]|nr:heme-binding protein [Burkholderiales bacterium]PZN04534.1 MAG: hypothetical protein DIU74_03505 [Pseudomonadota bacterium]
MRQRPCLTLDDCRRVAAAAEAEARKNNWEVAIAIVDDGGHLLYFQRMDGATPANAEIALRKARTAATTRRSTDTWEERIRNGRLATIAMPLLPLQGGLPIIIEGFCIGGVGVSGVQSHEDEQIAKAGIETLLR